MVIMCAGVQERWEHRIFKPDPTRWAAAPEAERVRFNLTFHQHQPQTEHPLSRRRQAKDDDDDDDDVGEAEADCEDECGEESKASDQATEGGRSGAADPVLEDGFLDEHCLMPGLRDGYGVTTVLGSVKEDTPAHLALMTLDPKRYPTRSSAKKAIRRGLVLRLLDVEGDSEDSEGACTEGDKGIGRLVALTSTTCLVGPGDRLVLQTRLGKGVCYPEIPWDKPNFELPVRAVCHC
jgi:hypothetical protein